MKLLRRQLDAARGGFTLIEVMLAVGILVFGAAAIIGMLTVGASLTRTAELRTTAASSLEAVLDDRGLQGFETGGSRRLLGGRDERSERERQGGAEDVVHGGVRWGPRIVARYQAK